MKFQHVLSYVASTLWAMEPQKLHEILSILAFRASGQTFSAEEIAARIGGRGARSTASHGAVAVIPIHGVIAHRMGAMDDTSGGTSTERIGAMLRQAHANPDVGSIVLDVDSPGGTVPGVQELAAEVFGLRGQGKKIVAHVNSLAASAAYWIASQADEIVSTPSGSAGSIGVFSAHQDLSKLLEKEGVNVTLISAGKFKVEGSPFAPLTDEAKAFMQGRVDEAYRQFVHDVARGRGASVADVRGGYGEGRVLTAKDAKAAGLIDRIATMDETLSGLMGRSASVGLRAEAEAVEFEAMAAKALEGDRLRSLERF